MSATNEHLSHSPVRVAIQGVRGAFHEMAARQLFGDEIELVPALSFEALAQLTADASKTDAGVMAIENSLAGSILGNYLLLQRHDFVISGEINLPIRQNLMALAGERLEELREVHSHPMALAQCDRFFSQYPHIRLVESEDTAESAARIARLQLRRVGAVGSALAAQLYGLHIVASHIETHPANYTRFLALRRAGAASIMEAADKVSVSFSLPHAPGSLSRVLAVLAEKNLNLTKIQSVPLVGFPGEYLFLLDFILPDPGQIGEVLERLRALTRACRVLGVYPSSSLTHLLTS